MHAEENALWSLDKADGMEKAYCCFNTNARDFARFGQLILNKGRWDDQPLISEAYLQEAITPDTTLIDVQYDSVNRRYGFQFWHLAYNGLSVPYMRGLQGQYIFAVPEKNAVIVRLGHERGTEEDWLAIGLKLIQKHDDRYENKN
jgi:CubicO group peptidase (beta-lactamase class C family)